MPLPTTASIKDHLKITFADDDALIASHLAAAIDAAGNYIGRPLVDGEEVATVDLAVVFLAAHFYSFRLATEDMPITVKRLLDPHREILFAPVKITSSITGGKEVAAMLQRVDAHVRRKLMRDTIKRNAQPVLEDMRKTAPQDSGSLRKALVVRVWTRERQGHYFASVVINPKVYRSHRMARSYKPDWVERYYRWTITGATVGKTNPVTIPPNPYPDQISERQFERYKNGVLTDLRQVIKETTT